MKRGYRIGSAGFPFFTVVQARGYDRNSGSCAEDNVSNAIWRHSRVGTHQSLLLAGRVVVPGLHAFRYLPRYLPGYPSTEEVESNMSGSELNIKLLPQYYTTFDFGESQH